MSIGLEDNGGSAYIIGHEIGDSDAQVQISLCSYNTKGINVIGSLGVLQGYGL